MKAEDLLSDIPEGFVPLEVAFSIQCLDSDGNKVLFNGWTDGLSIWEAWGMFLSATDDAKMRLRNRNCEED